MNKPRIGVLAGDPTGIGPEVAANLLAEPESCELAETVLIGDPAVFRDGATVAGVPKEKLESFLLIEVRVERLPEKRRVSAEAGAYTLATLSRAAEAILKGDIQALVYAPLNKQAMKMAGLAEEDEMHYLASKLTFRGLCSEINVGANLWTTRVTSHVPLRNVADLITEGGVCDAIRLLDTVMSRHRGSRPRIAVAGLNPHAGEGGLLGKEEISVIGPAVLRTRNEGIDASGPYPADTLFIAARRGDFDAVVTMYHDQGQIAMKLMGFEKGVTLHGGLPAPVTTPAHGTAFDIAGKGIANVGPIREAFLLAVGLCQET
jgi:4-hydroxythreonine-4-phosphate dehydrogenase